MKLSRSTEYALIAVAEIARSGHEKPILAKLIAQQHGIPLDYLLKVLQQLVHAGLLKSFRGPRGGFCLAQDAEQVSILRIIEAVEGPMERDVSPSEFANPLLQLFAGVYRQALSRAADTLSQATLATVLLLESEETPVGETPAGTGPQDYAPRQQSVSVG